MISFSSLGGSPKGDQNKWRVGNYICKQDKYSGEAIAEYLCSIFLQSSNCPVPYIPYRFHGSPNVCKSPSYTPKFSFFSFNVIIEWKLEVGAFVHDGVDSYEKWAKRVWCRLSSKDKVEYVCNLFNEFGVSRKDTLTYLTCMVELDTLVLNTDRHLNNFGIRYNHSNNCYEPMFLFDQGFSLAVGEGIFGSLRDMRDTRKVKMQPFSTSLRKNRSCLPEFRFAFDVIEFVKLLDSTNIYGKQFLRVSTQFSVLKGRLAIVYKKDINGINIMKYLEENGY